MDPRPVERNESNKKRGSVKERGSSPGRNESMTEEERQRPMLRARCAWTRRRAHLDSCVRRAADAARTAGCASGDDGNMHADGIAPDAVPGFNLGSRSLRLFEALVMHEVAEGCGAEIIALKIRTIN